MTTLLTHKTLRGVWCALILPWTDDDRLDPRRFRKEIRGYENTGVHGVYTGGTTGEFYAQDDDTFERITAIACEEAHAMGLPIQIGCTALSTRTVRQRIAVANKHAADAIQLALPFWLEMNDDEVMGFLKDVAGEAGRTPIVLYLTSRSKRKISPAFMGRILKAVPTVIGTKDTGAGVAEIKAFAAKAPRLAVFGGDNDFLVKVPAGGKGGYCSVTGLNARRVVEYYEHCAAGRLDQAKPIHDEIQGLMNIYTRWVKEDGLMDSAIDRLQRVAGGGCVGLRCQGPYRSGTTRHLRELVAWCRKNAPKFLE